MSDCLRLGALRTPREHRQHFLSKRHFWFVLPRSLREESFCLQWHGHHFGILILNVYTIRHVSLFYANMQWRAEQNVSLVHAEVRCRRDWACAEPLTQDFHGESPLASCFEAGFMFPARGLFLEQINPFRNASPASPTSSPQGIGTASQRRRGR